MMKVVFLLLLVSYNVIFCKRDFGDGPYREYSMNDERGIRMRAEIIQNLRNLCSNGNCSKNLKKQAEVLAEYCNSNDISQYIEAYFSIQRRTTNTFKNFLNGIINNGDPTIPVWNAAIHLLNFINKRTQPKRHKYKNIPSTSEIINSSALLEVFRNGSKLDFLQLYRKGLSKYLSNYATLQFERGAPNRKSAREEKPPLVCFPTTYFEHKPLKKLLDIYLGSNTTDEDVQPRWLFHVVP